MSTVTTTITASVAATAPAPENVRMRIDGSDPKFGDFRDDLARDGFAVVKGAIPRERALKYADEMFSWLENFNLGFDRHDPSSVHKDNLPVINEKGMCLQYAVTHEKFVWDVRSEPGVVETFEKVYNDKDLIVSFDAVNFGFPNRTDLPANKPWPHQDQDPEKPGFRCLQGLVNLLPNGPDDGGLIVCRGGHLLSEQFHRELADEERIPAWTPEWYGYTERGMKWLDDHGCKWEKVCAEPGDLLLWDSRTPHYNLSPKGETPRFCIYTCYMPVADTTNDDLVRKKEAFENWLGTTHWPNAKHTGSNVAKRDGKECANNRFRPVNEPQLSERAFKLTVAPCSWNLSNNPPPPIPGAKTYVYKTIRDLKLEVDVFIPDNLPYKDTTTAVLFLHGGGWIGEDRTEYCRPLFDEFLARQYLVASANYRLLPEHSRSIKMDA
ncbi:hypothetical protein BDV30DRAFT_251775 [Aspergillus minisclerotigenes]|uniref:Alpha/Beta hydrolase protein n=1 Tax=Aspergillus minisclerotigenes TaxID=656917 RepID=A0A5N6IT03_9EURO|nr:hypothetical protein BDV30DRAFT_251775 [Aspergillus minisclerotigenes]